MLLGLYVGMFANKKIEEKSIKKIVIVMLIISGIVLVMKSI